MKKRHVVGGPSSWSPRLVAGIYGMNFRHMPELDWQFGYPLALGLMFAAAAGVWWFVSRRQGLAVAVCRALKVMCVASDAGSLMALKRAAVSAEWELTPGATDEADAIGQIDAERPHVLVVFGPFERLVALAAERFPGMRIVTDRDTPGATDVATSLDEVRGLVKGSPRPGGPVI